MVFYISTFRPHQGGVETVIFILASNLQPSLGSHQQREQFGARAGHISAAGLAKLSSFLGHKSGSTRQ